MPVLAISPAILQAVSYVFLCKDICCRQFELRDFAILNFEVQVSYINLCYTTFAESKKEGTALNRPNGNKGENRILQVALEPSYIQIQIW